MIGRGSGLARTLLFVCILAACSPTAPHSGMTLNRGNIGRFAVYEDPEYVEDLRQNFFRRGALCLTAHFGNTELMAAANQLYGFPIAIVGRPLRNPVRVDKSANTLVQVNSLR